MELQKVTCENGVYRWNGRTDEEYKRFEYSHSMRMGLGICGFMLLMGLLLFFGDVMFLLMLLTCAVILLILMVTGQFILNRPGYETIPYEMSEDSIHFREGRGSVYLFFKRVRHTEIRGNRIILYTRTYQVPVYIPEEDFDQVSRVMMDFIRKKNPDVR